MGAKANTSQRKLITEGGSPGQPDRRRIPDHARNYSGLDETDERNWSQQTGNAHAGAAVERGKREREREA